MKGCIKTCFKCHPSKVKLYLPSANVDRDLTKLDVRGF